MDEQDGSFRRFELAIECTAATAPDGSDGGPANGPAAGPAVPPLTVDPSLPSGTRALLHNTCYQTLRDPDRHPARPRLIELGGPLAAGGVAALFVCNHPFSYGLTAAALCYAAGAFSASVNLVRRWRHARRHLPVIRGVRGRYVLTDDLVPEAGRLLARAHRAVDTVLGSTVHRENLVVDQQSNSVVLPDQIWTIADLLRDYSQVAAAAGQEARDDGTSTVMAARRNALRASLNGIERRVEALEAYAARITEADRLHAELRRIERLEKSGGQLLDLLARTVGDDMAVAEIDGLTEQAAAAAEALRAALDGARATARGLLPETAAR